MALFEQAIPLTLHYEGGYSNSKLDSGGETFAGISRVYNPAWKGWTFVDTYKATHGLANISADLLSSTDVMGLVREFYKANYWDSLRLGEIKDQQLAFNVFDTGVNMGTGRAAQFLQQAVNDTSNRAGLVVDGKVGSDTLRAVNSLPAPLLYENYNKLRRAKYEAIVAAKPSQGVFMASWLGRIKSYKTV